MRSGGLRIALIYVAVALAWIALSDRVLYSFHSVLDPRVYFAINSGKGFLFVLINAFFLYKLIKREEKKIVETTKKSIKADNEVKRLDDIITKVNNIIIITDQNNYIKWVNKAFEDFTGYSSEEVTGYTPATFFIDGDSNIDALSTVLANKRDLKSFSIEVNCRKKNSEKFWVYGEYTPLFDGRQKFTGYIAVYNDITALKQKIAELSLQNEKLKEIALICSHEIRRPVVNILGLANLMKSTELVNDKIKVFSNLDQSVQELDKIVHTLNYTMGANLNEIPGSN